MVFGKKKIGIALGGGGVRSLAGLGVLKRLQISRHKVKFVSGTSMGAIVGALYCYYQDTSIVEDKLRTIKDTSEFKEMSGEFAKWMSSSNQESAGIRKRVYSYYNRVQMFRRFLTEVSLVRNEIVMPVIKKLIPPVNIENLPVNFCCVCTDLVEGKKAVIREGALQQAIMGSVAVPGVIEPLKWKGMILSDGGSVSMIPVEEVIQSGANFVIAVDVRGFLRHKESFEKGVDIIERTQRITSLELAARMTEKADVVIKPAVNNIFWANFKKMDYCIAAGESAAFDIKQRI